MVSELAYVPSRRWLLAAVAVSCFCCLTYQAKAETKSKVRSEKTRLLILTDIGDDPDDKQSMCRLMTYTNEFDLEGLIATNLTERRLPEILRPGEIHECIEAYGKVRPNLLKHAQGYPTEKSLHDLVKVGLARPNREWMNEPHHFRFLPIKDLIGPGKDSEGSRWIIQAVDRPDPRPLWILCWGGPADLAQALLHVRETRSRAEVARFVAKIRVYAVTDQDATGPWIRDNFRELFYIWFIHEPYGCFLGMTREGDLSLCSTEWMETNIRNNHGPLGDVYPERPWRDKFAEGDTPSVLHLIPNGLNDPLQPTQGGWGGRFVGNGREFMGAPDHNPNSRDTTSRMIWPVARWRKAFQDDFTARMDWTVKPFDEANHNPIVVCNGDTTKKILEMTAGTGSTVDLSAAGSSDPDGDQLSYRWFVYDEASRNVDNVTIKNADSAQAQLVIPAGDDQKEIHVILEVTDDGDPVLFGYRRVIVHVKGKL